MNWMVDDDGVLIGGVFIVCVGLLLVIRLLMLILNVVVCVFGVSGVVVVLNIGRSNFRLMCNMNGLIR